MSVFKLSLTSNLESEFLINLQDELSSTIRTLCTAEDFDSSLNLTFL